MTPSDVALAIVQAQAAIQRYGVDPQTMTVLALPGKRCPVCEATWPICQTWTTTAGCYVCIVCSAYFTDAGPTGAYLNERLRRIIQRSLAE